jgi:hypothetical protein
MVTKFLKSIKDNYDLYRIKNNSKLLFQMTIFQNSIPRIQVLRQKSLAQFNIDIENKRGLAFIILIGELDEFDKKFKVTKYYKESRQIDLNGMKYVIFTDSDIENINTIYFDIFKEVFGYTEDDRYSREINIFKN